MSTADYVLLSLLAAAFALALISILKGRKNGCSGCTGDCSTCRAKKRK